MTVQKHATYDDANLILKLYDLRREEKLRQARAWFAASFKVRTLDELNALCPVGSEANAFYRMVTSYWEMVASFVTGGVLNETLFFQSGRELLYVWERIRDVVPQVRSANRDPVAFQNLETVAQSFIQFIQTQSPGAYESFAERVRGVATR